MDPKVPLEEKSRALEYCKKHLEGIWKEVNLNEVEICKISGGMSNLLYYCALKQSNKTFQDEPRHVLLRLYGPEHSDTEIQLEIFNQLATEKLGPILHGSFDEGRLEEYFPSSPLTWEQLTNDRVSAVVAKKIAAIHRLSVRSLSRGSSWLVDKYRRYHDFLLSNSINEILPSLSNKEMSESTKFLAKQLTGIDYKPEIDYVTSLLAVSKAPLVFSHNDLHQNNIILLHDSLWSDDKIPQDSIDDRIVIIDFEYCSYNYYTFDLANHLSEWCFDYNGDEYPYFNASLKRFPSEERQRQFLAHYINQEESTEGLSNGSEKTTSNKEGKHKSIMDKIDILFDEMQPFLMASNLLWALWAMKSAYTSKIKFGYWEMAKCKWDVYFYCKEQYKNRQASKVNNCEGKTNVQSSKM